MGSPVPTGHNYEDIQKISPHHNFRGKHKSKIDLLNKMQDVF